MRKCKQCDLDISHKNKRTIFCSLSCSTRFNRLKILHDNLPTDHKRCGKCKEIKEFSNFRKNKNSAFGYSYFCKDCDKQRIYIKDRRKILLNSAKKRAKDNNLDFDISIEDIILPEYCPILNIKLEFNDKIVKDNSYSIDRINSSKGYVKNNIQIISFKANTIKNNASLEEIKKVYEFMLEVES